MTRRASFVERFALVLVSLCATVLPAVSGAVESSPEMARLAAYSGADREQVLVQGAKKEGEVTMYTSIPINDINPLIQAFTEKYGVKVNLWRARSEQVVQRTVSEAQAGRHAVDVIDTNGPELEALHRERLLQKVQSPVFKGLISEAFAPHGEWTGSRLNIFSQAYNTNLIKKSDLPKSWNDLLDPRWKGKLGIEAGDYDWFSAVVQQLGGEQKGAELFREMVRKNGVSVRRGHTLLTQLTISGEVPLALTVYNYEPEAMKKQGAPVEWFVIGKAIARANGSTVLRRAPHPHAALLFYDFMLGEGQQYLAKRGIVVTSKALKSPISDFPLHMVDPAQMLDQHQKWERLYQEIFIKQAR